MADDAAVWSTIMVQFGLETDSFLEGTYLILSAVYRRCAKIRMSPPSSTPIKEISPRHSHLFISETRPYISSFLHKTP